VPLADPAAAVAMAVDGTPELPFWPSPPAPGGAMIDQRLAAELPGVVVDLDGGGPPLWAGRAKAPGRTASPPAAVATLEPFLKALAGRPPGWCLLPVPGPVSLALAVDAGGQPALAVPAARGPLGLGWAARLRSLVTSVREALPAWKLVLLLDEPGLGHELVAARPRLATDAWRELGAGHLGAEVTGLRAGADPPWPLILDLDPRLVAFDAAAAGDAATDDPAFRRLVEGGSAVAWGLVGDTATGAEALAARLVDLVTWTAGDYLPEVMARSLVTPTAGLGGVDATEAAARLALAAAVAAPARDLAGLP
jgi:hypothetical protein